MKYLLRYYNRLSSLTECKFFMRYKDAIEYIEINHKFMARIQYFKLTEMEIIK